MRNLLHVRGVSFVFKSPYSTLCYTVNLSWVYLVVKRFAGEMMAERAMTTKKIFSCLFSVSPTSIPQVGLMAPFCPSQYRVDVLIFVNISG